MKKVLLITILVLLFPIIVFANSDYEIDNYKIEITVNKNHLYKYKETFNTEFFGNEKYLIRDLDNETKKFVVNKNYTIETNKTSIAKIYSRLEKDRIEMTYQIQKEKKKRTYSINIRNNYDNEIKGVKFHINLPEYITANNIVIKNGEYEITDIVDFKVKGKTIEGTYNKVLKPGETININVELGKLYMGSINTICIVLPIIFTIISYFIWLYYGKDLPKIVERSSKIPKKITPIHIALANKGEINKEDSFYLLLDLASKGYITIKREKNEFYFLKGDKPFPTSYIESTFLKTLFRAGESISLTEYLNIISEHKDNKQKIYQADRVEPKNIKRKFNTAHNTINKILESQNEKDKYFENKSDKMKNILVYMIAIILIMITSLPFIEIKMLTLLPISIILSIATLYALIIFVNNVNLKKKKDKTIILAFAAVVILIILIIPSFRRNIVFNIAALISLVCSCIILFLYKYMPKRTIYGQTIYNKTLGFIDFINKIKKVELSKIQELNEDYLLEIIPLSLQLGVIEKVLKINKSTKELTWYKTKDFNYNKFYKEIQELKNYLTKEY